MKFWKKQSGLVARRERMGYTFVAHWALGLLLFFVVPLFSSLIYAFSNATITENGMQTTFAGLTHFNYILNEDANYVGNLTSSLGLIGYTLPIVLALSLILAVVLNQQFVGRTLFRAIFSLPIIIASSPIIGILSGSKVNAPIFNMTSGAEQGNYGGVIDFQSILLNLNLPDQINQMLASLLSNVFSLIWSCGVQTILFLAGLQSIPGQLYEVSKIEGANKWEEFWMVTVPSLRHVITLVLIYTMIQLFTASDNPLMIQAFALLQGKQIYDVSSAMLWLYFGIVLAVMGVVLGLYNRLCIRKWE